MPFASTDGPNSFVSCGERQVMSVPSGNIVWSVYVGTSRRWQRPNPPRRSLMNATRPFGSQHGKRSFTLPEVICSRCEPSARHLKMWNTVSSSHTRIFGRAFV